MRNAGALLARPSPARPGPGPMAEGLLKALDVSIGRRVEGLLAGDFRSNLLGTGSELAMMRPYVAGDDVRRIDWNVTARTGVPHVRVDLAERVLVTWLVLDTSVSMQFGTAERRKADVAEGVAVAIGHLSTRRGNRLGVVAFGGEEAYAIPPRQGRVGLVGLLAALRTEPPDGPGASTLAVALARTGALARQRSLVVVVSDFRGPADWRKPLLELAGHHDVIAVEIRDPARAGTDERRASLPRGSGDRTTSTGRHAQPAPPGTIRGRSCGRAKPGRALVHVGRRPPRGPLHVRRLAASARDVPATESRMSFTWPLVLLALAAVPVLVALYIDRDRRRVASQAEFGNPDLLPNMVDHEPGRLRYLPPLIMLVALVFLIVGVARPHATVSVPREEATVVLALDVSRSMKATDVEPTRLDAARTAAKTFLDQVPEKFRVGVVSFASRAAVGVAPTEDRELVVTALDTLAPGEGTAIGDAVALSLRVGQPQEEGAVVPPRAIVLLSDGARDGGAVEPAEAAKAAKEQGVPVYSVLVGTPDGVVEEELTGGYRRIIRVPTNPETLEQVAVASGGEFFAAPDAEGLSRVYEDLGSRLGTREQDREITDVFAAIAAALLLAAATISVVLFRRVP